MPSTEQKCRLPLVVGALGVVYGDLGTSPLYALRECFGGSHAVPPTRADVLGVLSLILWSLTAIVSIKYLALLLRANNKGEGGILALLSLAAPDRDAADRRSRVWIILGVFGAALLYGDGVITPALTVLSAAEGLEVATTGLRAYVAPLSVLVLAVLFSAQRHGTGRVGGVFGPVMGLWFVVLGALGLRGIWLEPGVLLALNPWEGAGFLLRHGGTAFFVLGAVFLALTGAEALYADLGHFGAAPIRRAWFWVVFPGLLLNYLGQGALLLREPAAARNPFYLLAPPWALAPLVALATVAAIIASQAIISGVYSLTMQAIQMGYLPRLTILHTSQTERGQIYLPRVNWLLMLACIGLVLGFGTSSALAGAYGIAVSLTMLTTTSLFYSAARRRWGWSARLALAVCGVFFLIELAFALANGVKIPQGGWFPLALAALIFTLMTTWRRGRQLLQVQLSAGYLPFDLFLEDLERQSLPRVPGTAVFLSGNPEGTPIALLHNIRHNKSLHQRLILLTVRTADTPYVHAADRLEVKPLRPDIYRVLGRYGFMEQPNVLELLRACAERGLAFKESETSFFLSRETIIPSRGPGLATWRRRLFAAISRNAQPASAFFRIPPSRVVELGMQVQL